MDIRPGNMDLSCEFDALCVKLEVPTNVKTDAWASWTELGKKNLEEFKTFQKKWLACLLYTTSIDFRYPYGLSDPQILNGSTDTSRLDLMKLLWNTGMSMSEFCSKLRSLKDNMALSETSQEHVTMLQRNYLICAAIFDKFERIFKDVFQQEQQDVQTENLHINEEEKPSYKRKLIWSLFVLAKEMILGSNVQLISSFHVLLCALDYVIFFTPSFQLNAPFDEIHRESSTEGHTTGHMRKFLCQKYGASFEDVQATYDSWSVNISRPHGTKLQELRYVQQQYHTITESSREFDELLFSDRARVLVPEVAAHDSGVLMNPQIRATPVRTAMKTLRQLKYLLENAVNDRPSAKLQSYFEKCSNNPQESIEDRLVTLQGTFMTSMRDSMGRNYLNVAENRFRMAVQLHFQVMETLLKSEEERLSITDFSTLLHRDTFHTSLLACAIEVVLTTYKTSGDASPNVSLTPDSSDPTAFPWILQVFDLKAYNFFKVLESFVKAEPRLSREIVRHLQNVENRILESIAWEESSPIYEAIRVSEITSIQVPLTGEMREPTSNSAPCDLFMSPVPQRSNQNGSTNGSTNGTHVVQSTSQVRRSHSVNLFLNKVARLGYNRLLSLCSKLGQPRDLIHKIWTCFEYCYSHRPDIMKNRHLDQIMMCSIYAICKVSDREVRFKDIVSNYKTFPHATVDVYRNVLIQGDQYDSIIIFYNNVFMGRTKSFILQFSPSRHNQTKAVLSPVPKSVASSLTNSPVYTLPGRKNFFVSPMKESPFKQPVPLSPSQMTPRTRQLYSFGESLGSAEKLQKINESMRALKRNPSVGFATSKRQKKLTFENSEDTQSNNNNDNGNGATQDQVRDIVARKAVELVSAFGKNDENGERS